MKQEIQNLNYCNEAIKLKESIETDFLTLGKYLYNIKEHSLFEPQWSSFLEFLDELKISVSNARRLMQIYSTFVLTYGFTPKEISKAGGPTVLGEILPAIKSREDAERWLSDAEILTKDDLRKNVKEAKTGIDMAKCKHKNTYTVVICRDCGDRHEVFPV